MKFSFLKQIVSKEACQLKDIAAYSGAYNDGGYQSLLNKFDEYKQSLIIKLDLKPSELSQLNDVEIGEPQEFFNIIQAYKLKILKSKL